MATKLFIRDSKDSAIGVFRDLLTTAGAGVAPLGEIGTAASGTEIQWKNNGQVELLEWISGRAPSGGFTLAGTMTFSIWARESNMNANCGARARVFKRTAAGVETEVGGGPYNDGVEFGTGATEMVWTGAPTSTAFAEDDRLIVRYYITNVGTMGGVYVCSLDYGAVDATTGDSFFEITENVTFKAEASIIVGTAAPTFSAVTTASAAKAIIKATAAPALGSFASVSPAKVLVKATAAPTLATITSVGTIVTIQAITATAAPTFGALTTASTTKVIAKAAAAPTLAAFTAPSTGLVRVKATAAPTLSAFTSVGTASVIGGARLISGAPTFGALTTASAAKARLNAAGVAALSAFGTVAATTVRVKASGSPPLGTLSSVGTATVVGGARTISGAPALAAFGSQVTAAVRLKATATIGWGVFTSTGIATVTVAFEVPPARIVTPRGINLVGYVPPVNDDIDVAASRRVVSPSRRTA